MAERAFQHLEPGLRLFNGKDALSALPSEMQRSGCGRAVVVCGRSVAVGGGLRRVHEALGGRFVGVFNGVRPHSPVSAVEAAALDLKALGADCIVAVGGGSAVVTARAAAILMAEAKPLHELCTRRLSDGRLASPKLLAPKLPLFVVPTTPTTAAVKAGTAVFDEVARVRMAMFDPKTRAQAVFIDPMLTGSAPSGLFLTASLNTLAMAIEGLESASGDALSDAMLLHALRLLRHALPGLRELPEAEAWRGDLMMAAVLCGRGTDFAGGGLASVLGHALGSRCEIASGLANAIVLPHTLSFNACVTRERGHAIAEALGGRDGASAADQVRRLLDPLAIPLRLRDAAVASSALDDVATVAMNDWFLTRNPRPVQDFAELQELLRAAW